MTGIFNGIQAIINTLIAPIKYLLFIIEEIYQFGELMLATVTQVISNVSALPEWVYNYAILSVSVIIILRLLGRSTQ